MIDPRRLPRPLVLLAGLAGACTGSGAAVVQARREEAARPTLKRRRLIEHVRLGIDQRQVMPRLENEDTRAIDRGWRAISAPAHRMTT